MKCSRCGKKREVLFNREGGRVSVERAHQAGRTKQTEEQILSARYSICLSCIKEKTTQGSWWRGDIITNPTIKPTGDPLEWVIADE